MMSETLSISVQATPNPNAAKFTLNRVVATQGTTYRDAASTQAPWAKQLLAIDGVTQVFAMNNFVSVTKTPQADWNVLGPQIERVLRDTLA